ncbi:MAG: phosphatidate cytidylyltransferase, partial [Lachnospiraceae bacterium]|nr:phosphatidate cytidylyltransferase [Lachnospiraceae bacterium]
MKGEKTMRTRIISGVVIGAIVLALIFLPADILIVFLGIMSLLAQHELYKAYGMKNKNYGVYAGFAATVFYYLCLKFNWIGSESLTAAVCFLGIMAVYVFTFPRVKSAQIAVVFFGFFYISVLLSFMYGVRALPDGKWLLPLVFISAWVNDTCAYFVGRKLGKHRLAPVLSPKKSIEGFVGGIAGAVVVGLIYGLIYGRTAILWSNTG